MAHSPQGPDADACRKFAKIFPGMSARLARDQAATGPLTVDGTLNSYGNDMATWSSSVTSGLANDLGDAALAVDQVAEPLSPASAPDVQSAVDDINAVRADCTALA